MPELRIFNLKAEGIVAADKRGTSDAFAIVTYKDKTHKTKTIKKTLDPVWTDFVASFELVRGTSSLVVMLGVEALTVAHHALLMGGWSRMSLSPTLVCWSRTRTRLRLRP